jgi:hypothetical protein
MLKQHPVYDQRHGGPYDRGSADSYYRRPAEPHYYEGGTAVSRRIEESDMTAWQITEYNAGYDANERRGDYKDYR